MSLSASLSWKGWLNRYEPIWRVSTKPLHRSVLTTWSAFPCTPCLQAACWERLQKSSFPPSVDRRRWLRCAFKYFQISDGSYYLLTFHRMCGNDISVIADPNELWRNQLQKQIQHGEIVIGSSHPIKWIDPYPSPRPSSFPSATLKDSSPWKSLTATCATRSWTKCWKTTSWIWRNWC